MLSPDSEAQLLGRFCNFLIKLPNFGTPYYADVLKSNYSNYVGVLKSNYSNYPGVIAGVLLVIYAIVNLGNIFSLITMFGFQIYVVALPFTTGVLTVLLLHKISLLVPPLSLSSLISLPLSFPLSFSLPSLSFTHLQKNI